MTSDSADLKHWLNLLPHSKMVFPRAFKEQIKYFFWRLYTPFHSLVRDILLWLGIIQHAGRQNYLLGKVAPDTNIKDLATYLVSKGYGNHFIAWKDKDELVSLRYVKDFKYQYHIRIFKDGEVRGHYEFTPECHPLLHLKAVDQKDRRTEFLDLLENFITPVNSGF